MPKPKIHFHHREKVSKKTWKNRILLAVAVIMFFAGGYLLLLVMSPKVDVGSTSISLNTEDDQDDKRDRIQIEKINLEVPYFAGDASELEKGAWWRFPERGSPTEGGNFILSAHRFFLGLTPQGTRERSPFYQLGEVQPGDKIRVFYANNWYEYEVEKNYAVERTAVEIEGPTVEHRLTLYTCSLAGEADGRVVIQAKPLFDQATIDQDDSSEDPGSVLL